MSNSKVNLPIKLAVFQSSSARFTFELIYEEAEGQVTDMARVSEWVEITFPPRTDQDEILKEKVAGIDKSIEQIRARFGAEIEQLLQRRQDLLSISYDSPIAAGTIIDDGLDDIPF